MAIPDVKTEYMIVETKDYENPEPQLDGYGKQGWLLLQVIIVERLHMVRHYMARRVRDDN